MQKILVFILLFGSISLLAQENITDFKNIVDTTKNKELKLTALDSLISLNRNKNTDAFVAYSLAYITLAEELKYYDKAISKGTNVFYTMNIVLNKNQEALNLMKHLQKYENKVKDSFLIGNMYLKIGGGYYQQNSDKAIENYTLAIEKLGQKDSIFRADAYLFRGQSKDIKGDFLGAIKDYEIAALYYEKLNDIDYVLNTKNAIGIIYGKNGFFKEASNINEEVIAYGRKNKKYNSIITGLYNQATQFKKNNMPEKQEKYLLEAFKINRENNNNEIGNTIDLLQALIKLYISKKEPKKVKAYYDSLINYEDQLNENPFLTRNFLSGKAAYLLNAGNLNEAERILKKVISLNETLQDKEGEIKEKMALVSIYDRRGDIKNSYRLFRDYHHLKDSIFNIEKANSLLYYQTLYETERKERKIEQQQASITLLEKDAALRKRILTLVIIGLVLIFLSVFLYRNRLYLIRSKELQENFTQQLLASQEAERKRISKDLHDGLGQSLLLIKNKVLLSDESTKNMVNNAIEEVRAISKALHPFQLSELGLSKAIQNILNQLDENTNIFISSDVDSLENIFTPEQEINIFRIIQESMNNIIKHAQAEAARVLVKKKDTHIFITIKDNGKGFDFSEKYHDFSSLGLKTLKERTKTLNGSMKIDTVKNKGTELEFLIPYTK